MVKKTIKGRRFNNKKEQINSALSIQKRVSTTFSCQEDWHEKDQRVDVGLVKWSLVDGLFFRPTFEEFYVENVFLSQRRQNIGLKKGQEANDYINDLISTMEE